MDLPIRRRTLANVKHSQAICLNSGYIFFISLGKYLKRNPVSAPQS